MADNSNAGGDMCQGDNDFDGRLGVRISAIFVILVGSMWGAWFPVFARRHASKAVPEWAFFIAKFFGSGVIVATAFIHLLSPAEDAFRNECVAELVNYDWVSGIILVVVFIMFFLELMTMRYGSFGGQDHEDAPDPARNILRRASTHPTVQRDSKVGIYDPASAMPGERHLDHVKEHVDNSEVSQDWAEAGGVVPETYSAQLTSIFILEFGVIFHSVFVGLTLAVAGEEFNVLYIVLVFHQTFEGLALGSRLASVPWPRSKRWTPYILAVAYGLTTPIAIAVGLGVRESYAPGSRTALITNGVFDSISAGILIYTGLVELMAHEFMFSNDMKRASIKTVLAAFALMCLGAGLMALLGEWA